MKNSSRRALSFVVAIVAFTQLVNAHTYFSSISIDGVSHPEGECIRPHPSSQYDYPISALDRPNGLSSADMTCGWLPASAKAASKKCPVNPGSTVTLQWHYEMGLSSDSFIIDPSHKGPCIVYMAKSETGAGNVWFKIFEDGYDQASKSFCVTRMRANGGKFSVKIPTDIAPGNYLLRGELLALHEGDQLYGAQPYVGCAEITVGGSGTINPPGVAFPGAYSPNDPGIHFDIYSGKITSYPIPGPSVYVSGSAPAPTPTPVAVTTGSTTKAKATTGSTTAPRSTTGSSTTAAVRATTGSVPPRSTTASSTTSAPKATTGNNMPVSSSTTSASSGAMCYLPGTPNLNGKIHSAPPTCGNNAPKARCAEGLCCSKYGYCGPMKNRDGKYMEMINGKYEELSEVNAFALYCTNSTGDYRKVPCSSISNLGALNEQNGTPIVVPQSDESSFASSSKRLEVALLFVSAIAFILF